MNTFSTGCPVVDKTQETFVQHVNVGGERQRIEFTKEITWLQKSESKLQYMHGGKVLVSGSSHTDFYGYLTSMHDFAPEATAAKYSITQDSSLELVILTTVFKTPATQTLETIQYNSNKDPRYKSKYAHVPDEWRKEADSEWTPGEKIYPRVERIELVSGIVWTSKNTPEQNEALAIEFKQKWAVNHE